MPVGISMSLFLATLVEFVVFNRSPRLNQAVSQDSCYSRVPRVVSRVEILSLSLSPLRAKDNGVYALSPALTTQFSVPVWRCGHAKFAHHILGDLMNRMILCCCFLARSGLARLWIAHSQERALVGLGVTTVGTVDSSKKRIVTTVGTVDSSKNFFVHNYFEIICCHLFVILIYSI